MVSNLFNDMSGLDITKGLLKASLEASRDGDIAAAKQATDTLKAITDAFGKLVKAGGGNGENLTKTAKGLGSLFNLAGTGGGGAGAGGTDAAGAAVDAGTSGGAAGGADVVGAGGADAIAGVGGGLGSVLEALGPAAAVLLA